MSDTNPGPATHQFYPPSTGRSIDFTFFAKFCEDEGISTKGNYKKGGTELYIYSKEDVIKFAELIGSEKINNFLKQHKLTYHSLRKTLRY